MGLEVANLTNEDQRFLAAAGFLSGFVPNKPIGLITKNPVYDDSGNIIQDDSGNQVQWG